MRKVYSSDSGQGPAVGSCEHDNKPSSFIKGRVFPDHLTGHHLLNDSVPWRIFMCWD